MIKIDFHIHTFPSKDKNEIFSFSLDKLKQYVEKRDLDAIAITNHNLFNQENYDILRNQLSAKVFPGIEVDLENGHILVVTDQNNIEDFKNCCNKISSIISLKKTVSIDEFLVIFEKRNNYLFIPHYKKKPFLSTEHIKKFGTDIFCGEVDNQNKFIRLYKDKNDLVPVLFSDSRLNDNSSLPMRFTYLDISSTAFNSIKEALKDREKVFLTENKGHSKFQILDDGTEASTGLNIILGKRSSGKTHTINAIYNNFNDSQKIKYIKQFELIEKKDEEKEEQIFNDKLGERSSAFTEEYLLKFKTIVDYVQRIDIETEKISAENYINCLLEFASESDKHDIFAKVPVFSEQNFSVPSITNLIKIIEATQSLIETNEYKKIVSEYIAEESLKTLFIELVSLFRQQSLRIKSIEITNEIVKNLKNSLTIESNQNSIPNFDILKYAHDRYEVENFKKLCLLMNQDVVVKNKNLGKFVLSAKRTKIQTASELQKIFKSKVSFSQLVLLREQPYDYLMSFKKSNLVPDDSLYKIFVKIDFNVLNEHGLRVSGGERAEFNLEEKLSDADNFEMLLIDEPESSFDNIFLKESIFKRIKSLAKEMPVFVSTHNNVVGASFKPNFIIFTEKRIKNGKAAFYIYCGEPTDSKLLTIDGETKSNKNIQLDCLEGGEETYNERRDTYENIKN